MAKPTNFKQWMKGVLAINFAREALADFVETEMNELQKDLIQSVIANNQLSNDVTCTQCTTSDLLPCPTTGFCNRERCEVHGYHTSDKKPNQPCPNNLCNDLKNAIEKEHRFHSPSWQYSDARRWSTEPMEICKCFLPSVGYDRIHSIQDIDFNGILSIVINNKRFQLKMASALSIQRNVCTKARDVEQAIRHSESFELSDTELSQHIEVLKDLLSDQAYLANDAKAKYAVKELTKLQKTDVVTTEDMMQLLQDITRTQICDQHEKALGLIENNFSSTIRKELTELADAVVKASRKELKKMKPELENVQRSIQQNIDKTDKDEAPIHIVSTEPEIFTIAEPDSRERMSFVDNYIKFVHCKIDVYRTRAETIKCQMTAHKSDTDINPDFTSTEPTKGIPDKETQLLTKKWEDYIQGIDDDETITESLMDELGLPTTDQLNKLQGEYLEEKSKESKKSTESKKSEKSEKISNLLKTIEHRVCKVIMSNNKDIQYAWLAFTAEKPIDVHLIVEVKQIRSKINCENIPYRLQVIQFDDFSKEAELLLAKCDENESFKGMDAIQDCINNNVKELMKKHKHLSIINASTVRSKDFYKSGEVNDIKENCIAFYVRRKGLIPVGEEPFEDRYDGFPIDVREGVFYPSMQAGNEGLILKMGLRIKAGNDVDYGGTLGGFIDHPQYGVCGFTCAHVLLDKLQMNKLTREHEMTYENFSGEISVYLDRNSPDSPVKIGHVVIAILTEGDRRTPGMDVAFFQIEKSLEVAGVLANINNADDNKPFNSGKVYKPPKFSKNLSVYKYGSTSGKTEGKFDCYSLAQLRLPVKPDRSNGFIDHVLHNQIAIKVRNRKFSELGDSGSLVLMDGDNGEQFGIGIVEGISTDGISYVTPLGPILEKMGLSSLKRFKEDVRESIKRLENGHAEILKKLEELTNKLSKQNETDETNETKQTRRKKKNSRKKRNKQNNTNETKQTKSNKRNQTND